MNPPHKVNNNQLDNKTKLGGIDGIGLCLIKGEGIDNSIRNEKKALDARLNGTVPELYPNISPREEGQPTRLASKNGNIVRIDHEAQYKAKWEAYKKEHYPARFLVR